MSFQLSAIALLIGLLWALSATPAFCAQEPPPDATGKTEQASAGIAVPEPRRTPNGSAVAGSTDAARRESLLQVRRLYIERFNGNEAAVQIRDMLIAALERTRLFVLTENPDRADALIRGSAEDLIYTDTFQSNESVGARAGISASKGSSTSRGGREAGSLSAGVTDHESLRIQERRHEATASVRIINREGDVIWSCTAESQGGKFKSASVELAEKISRQLQQEYDRIRAARPVSLALPGAAESSPAAQP